MSVTITPYYRKDANGKWVSDTNLPTPDELRYYWCFGLPLADDQGRILSDDDLKRALEAAISVMEGRLGIYLKPTVITCNPEERGLQKGIDYEVAEPPYDYSAKAWMQYGFLQLRERPVQQVTGFKLVLPNGNIIMDFMTRPEWIKLYPRQGQIHIVPYAGDPTLFYLMGGSASGYPFVTGMINSNLPQMIYVDYVAGYPLGGIPNDVRNVVAKMAAVDVLGIAGDAVMVGISSLSTSVDGLSESVSLTASATSATYGAHIKQLQEEIDAFFDTKKVSARTAERGFTMTGI